VADFNGDGHLDLVTPNRNHGNFTILLGDGSGSFGAPATFADSGGSNFIVVGDFNGDENADIATNVGRKVSVFLGNGDGRVYHIFFTADDGNGGVTAGEVTVDVPHDQRGAPAVDGGALYDSTQSTSSPSFSFF
jgi:hypothetical protein